MAGADAARAKTCTRPKRERHHGNLAHAIDDQLPAGRLWDVGAGILQEHLDGAAAARAIDQLNQWHPIFDSLFQRDHRLAADRGIRRAAAHGEIVAQHHGRAAIKFRPANDGIGRHEAVELLILIIGRDTGDLANLVKASWIDQKGHALADGELAPAALPRDRLFAAHLFRHAFPPAKLFYRLLPRHGYS